MHIYICTCIYIYIHINLCMYICASTYVYTYIYIHINVCKYTYISWQCVCAREREKERESEREFVWCVCVYTYIHTSAYRHAYKHAYIHTHIHTYIQHPVLSTWHCSNTLHFQEFICMIFESRNSFIPDKQRIPREWASALRRRLRFVRHHSSDWAVTFNFQYSILNWFAHLAQVLSNPTSPSAAGDRDVAGYLHVHFFPDILQFRLPRCVSFTCWYGVATISRLLKIICLLCRIYSLLKGCFAKDTYNVKEPPTCSYPIVGLDHVLCACSSLISFSQPLF